MRAASVLAPLALLAAALPTASGAAGLVEPHMHIAKGGTDGPHVALTFDACMGAVDHRILDALVAHAIPATIFVTKRWIDRNDQAMTVLLAHRDLFELEDHGARHVPAVLGGARPYGIAPAGTPTALRAEVEGGADAIEAATGHRPGWFRGATALYSPDAIDQIQAEGFRIGGFSINGDLGATAPAAVAERRVEKARDGDVIIAHINQPNRRSGEGVIAGILALQAQGYRFVRLDAAPLPGS